MARAFGKVRGAGQKIIDRPTRDFIRIPNGHKRLGKPPGGSAASGRFFWPCPGSGAVCVGEPSGAGPGRCPSATRPRETAPARYGPGTQTGRRGTKAGLDPAPYGEGWVGNEFLPLDRKTRMRAALTEAAQDVARLAGQAGLSQKATRKALTALGPSVEREGGERQGQPCPILLLDVAQRIGEAARRSGRPR